MQAIYAVLLSEIYSYPNEVSYDSIIQKETDHKNLEIMKKIKQGFGYQAFLDSLALD